MYYLIELKQNCVYERGIAGKKGDKVVTTCRETVGSGQSVLLQKDTDKKALEAVKNGNTNEESDNVESGEAVRRRQGKRRSGRSQSD